MQPGDKLKQFVLGEAETEHVQHRWQLFRVCHHQVTQQFKA